MYDTPITIPFPTYLPNILPLYNISPPQVWLSDKMNNFRKSARSLLKCPSKREMNNGLNILKMQANMKKNSENSTRMLFDLDVLIRKFMLV